MLGPVFKLGSTSSGGGGTVTSPGLHPFRLPMADGTQDLIDSKLQAVNISGDEMIFIGNSLNIGASTAVPSAKFEVDSTDRGILIPRMTAVQRLAIAGPADGLLIYQTNGARGIYRYDTILAAWQIVGAGTVTSPGMNAFKFPVADAAQNIVDSRLQQDSAIGNNLYFAGQSMNIGAGAAVNSAILEADSTGRGFLEPRMTNAQRAAIAAPATGLQVFCTDAPVGMYYFNGAVWLLVGTGSGTVTSSGGIFANHVAMFSTATNIVDTGVSYTSGNWIFPAGTNAAVQQLQGNGSAPTIAGSGNTTAVSITGTDLGGNLSITFAVAVTANSQAVRVTFNQVFATPPRCIVITPAAGASGIGIAALALHAELSTITTSQFDIFIGVNTALLALATYNFYYFIVQ